MFIRSLIWRSSNHNYCLHTQRVFTQDWLNSFWTAVAWSVLFLYRRLNSRINALEGECLCLREISINRNNLFAVLFLSVYLFIRFFYTDIVVACLLPNFIFYTDVIAIILFIRWWCGGQHHYFCFWIFSLSFLKHHFLCIHRHSLVEIHLLKCCV